MNLSNENLLQLYSLASIIGERLSEQMKRLIKIGLDWDEILESASWHNIEPILYYNLKDIPENKFIPIEVMNKLKNAYYQTIAINLAIYDELTMILEEFNKNSLQAIVLKGAALAKTVYSNISLRPMIDIDLLVEKEDLLGIEALLNDLGYIFEGNRSHEWFRENYYHILYVHPKKRIQVELHWHIACERYPSKIAITDRTIIENWWGKACQLEINGKKAQILCPEHLLFHLCIHFLKHRFQTPSGGYRGVFTSKNALIQLCDIYLTLSHYRDVIDWDIVNQESEKYGANDIIYSTLLLIRNTFGNDDLFVNIPIRSTPENIDEELIGLIQNRLFCRDYVFSITPVSFLQSALDGNFQKKIKNLLNALFPHPEMLANIYSVPLNSKKLYTYYIIYLIDFLKNNRKKMSINPSRKEVKVINRWIGSD